jgi:hypothetical protein
MAALRAENQKSKVAMLKIKINVAFPARSAVGCDFLCVSAARNHKI